VIIPRDLPSTANKIFYRKKTKESEYLP